METGHSFEHEFLKKFINCTYEEDSRTIVVRDVFVGPEEIFFLLEWEDVGVFFCAPAYSVIAIIKTK